MKNKRNSTLVISVSYADYKNIKSGNAHAYKTTLSKRLLRFLPTAYEDCTGTMLIFPKQECPKMISFKPRWRPLEEPVVREIANVMAFKEEDMSETLRFLFK